MIDHHLCDGVFEGLEAAQGLRVVRQADEDFQILDPFAEL
jgi:hypothetical protein